MVHSRSVRRLPGRVSLDKNRGVGSHEDRKSQASIFRSKKVETVCYHDDEKNSRCQGVNIGERVGKANQERSRASLYRVRGLARRTQHRSCWILFTLSLNPSPDALLVASDGRASAPAGRDAGRLASVTRRSAPKNDSLARSDPFLLLAGACRARPRPGLDRIRGGVRGARARGSRRLRILLLGVQADPTLSRLVLGGWRRRRRRRRVTLRVRLGPRIPACCSAAVGASRPLGTRGRRDGGAHRLCVCGQAAGF